MGIGRGGIRHLAGKEHILNNHSSHPKGYVKPEPVGAGISLAPVSPAPPEPPTSADVEDHGHEYHIEFQLQRAGAGEEDFEEIGFGSTGGWSDVDQAAHILISMIQNREWETENGMPDPDSIP